MTVQTILSKHHLRGDGLICRTNSLVKGCKAIIHLDHEIVGNNAPIMEIVVGVVFAGNT